METTYTTYDGQVIDLTGLTPKERKFLEDARALIAKGVDWTEFENFYLNKRSAVWFEGGDPKAERKVTTKVTRAPLYRVVQDMGMQLGVDQGYLSPDEGPMRESLKLEQFEDRK